MSGVGTEISNLGDENVTITDTNVSDASNNKYFKYTEGTITADSVTALTGTALALNTLLTAGNNESVANQFSVDSFASLSTATVTDSSMSIADLNGAISVILQQANQHPHKEQPYSVDSGATITTGDEAAFTTLLDYETNGLIALTDQILNVNIGTISVDNANLLSAATTGTVIASITTTERVSELTTLSETTNAYTIVISSEDAVTSDLNTINDATTVAVDLTNVTPITSSSLTDLGTLSLQLIVMSLVMIVALQLLQLATQQLMQLRYPPQLMHMIR